MNASGIYSIHPNGIKEPLKVYCDMTTAGGGWTVFQRRMNGSVDFNANWSLYKDGFGSVWGEHWLGNQNVYHLTNQRPCELRIDLYDFKGNTMHATYSHFSISNETMKYELRLGLFSGGGAGDCLTQHNGHKFSTRDQDNDLYDEFNCAEVYQAGWWYKNTSERMCRLNGIYINEDATIIKFNKGILWSCWSMNSLKGSEMKLRPFSEA
ncbi:ficolin-1-like [Lytechinus pictus]|uniref:ficolin-1-like n=1 Tax=Lytechinus pictus TaxID=7653 RepID=UPI0030BA2542